MKHKLKRFKVSRPFAPGLWSLGVGFDWENKVLFFKLGAWFISFCFAAEPQIVPEEANESPVDEAVLAFHLANLSDRIEIEPDGVFDSQAMGRLLRAEVSNYDAYRKVGQLEDKVTSIEVPEEYEYLNELYKAGAFWSYLSHVAEVFSAKQMQLDIVNMMLNRGRLSGYSEAKREAIVSRVQGYCDGLEDEVRTCLKFLELLRG